MANSMAESDWTVLLDRIEHERCTPFLSAGVSSPRHDLEHEIANNSLSGAEEIVALFQARKIELAADAEN